MGSIGVDLEILRRRISELQPLNKSKSNFKNILIVDENAVNEIYAIRDRLRNKGKLPEAEVKEVQLDRIYTGQNYLEKKKLENMADKPIHELAKGYYYQGDVIVTDGNHRLALAKLNNQKTVRMKVIDLDKKWSKKNG